MLGAQTRPHTSRVTVHEDVTQTGVRLDELGSHLPEVETACDVGNHQPDRTADVGEVPQLRGAVTR